MTKVYSGTMRLGEYTPSYDADTEVTKTLPWEHIQDSHIMRAKQAFIGDIMQVPPMFSAIKVGGERLYKKARRGEEISVPPRPVTIYDFHLERNSDNRSYSISPDDDEWEFWMSFFLSSFLRLQAKESKQ
jgi:tRNA pseudouridine55 synthase